ncbi:MAG: single-stranded-DNA-specific exonuclease RecJ, partial [Parcubacteria group bacterium CG_4_10_14_0_8_um_filter_35_7]
KTKRLGLRKLIEIAGLSGEGKIDAHSISFGLSPRLNTAGRLNHANNVYKLLVTDEEEEAIKLATELDESNRARRRLTDEMLKESLRQIGEVKNQKILFALGDDWLVGMVGLVAGKI